MKPVMPEDVLRELTFIYDDIKPTPKQKIQVRTFGGFSVSVNGKALCFKRAKAKELLACLVDRRGVEITTREACALLWEDTPYDKVQKSYFQTIVAELKSALKSAGIEDILIKKRNSLSINPELLDCDSYQFMDGDPKAINSYSNNYMSCYSWAEFTAGFMYKRSKEYHD